MGWANTSGGSATTTFWDYISNGLQDGGQLAYTVGRESRGGGRKGGDRQKNRFMPTGLSREPCGKVCYVKSQRLIRKSGHSFHGAPSLSASARSISPSASSARSSKLILGGRSSGGDSIGWAGAGEGAVEANRKAWRARGDELGPGAGLRMYANRGDGRRGYGGQRRTRGGRRAYLGDGGHETGCSLHFCMRGWFRGGEASFYRRFSLFNSQTFKSCRRNQIHETSKSPETHRSLDNIGLHNWLSPHASVIIPLLIGF